MSGGLQSEAERNSDTQPILCATGMENWLILGAETATVGRHTSPTNDSVINYLFVSGFERRLIAWRLPGDGDLLSAVIT